MNSTTHVLVGYEERHVQKDMDLVKAMWRLGNIDYEFDSIGIPTGVNSSIIALDKTSTKIKKKYNKIRSKLPYD